MTTARTFASIMVVVLCVCKDVSVSGFGSPSSGFTRTLPLPTILQRSMGPMIMYEKNHDPPSAGSPKHNMWSVLANTEKWISNILGKGENPYTRKEVSYICELADDDALVVAGLWRRSSRGTGAVRVARPDGGTASQEPPTKYAADLSTDPGRCYSQ